MKKAYVFPGQGAQYPGMGADLCEQYPSARRMFDIADECVGFRISEAMCTGSTDELRQTHVTQLAVFVHAVAKAHCVFAKDDVPDAVAGHSLGEFSALVAAGTLTFEDGLKLVACRAEAMHTACKIQPSTMAVIIGLPVDTIERICTEVKDEVVVPANYNAPGQLVISGTKAGVNQATELLKVAGARRVLPISVEGAFHSPLMNPARKKLALAIENTHFQAPLCPIYQNVDGKASKDVKIIQKKLIDQLTSPVRWESLIKEMVKDGFEHFFECGAGNVLQGLIKKIAPHAKAVAADK